MIDESWGLLARERAGLTRRTRGLGLGAAVRAFNELAVPGIGGVWFARPLAWAVLGIRLARGRSFSAVSVANAIDWASRPPAPPFGKKPVATLGASPGMHGTVRGQTQLRELCIGLGMYVVPKPEVYVGKANEKFDAEANLTDEATKKFVAELLVNLADFTRTLRGR